MSTLQCANIWFESTANNRIQYFGSNNFAFVVAGSNAFICNTTNSPFSNGVTTTIGVGYTVAPYNLGIITSNTTLNPALGNYQYTTANAANIVITAPTSDCAIDVLVTNGSAVNNLTFSGFTVQTNGTGDIYANTNTNRYILSVRRINAISTYVWKALQ